MANWFQRAVNRVLRREEAPAAPEPQQQAPAPEEAPRQERRGLFGRIRDVFQPGRAELERERQELAERQREVEAREREVEQRQREIEERQAPPSPAAPRELPPDLQGIPPIMPLGPKGRDGAAYTGADEAAIMGRLREAADLDRRVSLRVHDENGWHDLFLNNVGGKGFHKPARGVSAGFLLGAINEYDGIGEWVEDGADIGEDGGYEDELGEADGYQLVVWS